MKNLIFIFVFFLYFSCNNTYNNFEEKKQQREKQEKIVIKNKKQDEIVLVEKKNNRIRPLKNKKINTKIDSTNELKIYDEFNMVIFYYETYIGKAYSRQTYNKYFENNRDILDNLIEKYERSLSDTLQK